MQRQFKAQELDSTTSVQVNAPLPVFWCPSQCTLTARFQSVSQSMPVRHQNSFGSNPRRSSLKERGRSRGTADLSLAFSVGAGYAEVGVGVKARA